MNIVEMIISSHHTNLVPCKSVNKIKTFDLMIFVLKPTNMPNSVSLEYNVKFQKLCVMD